MRNRALLVCAALALCAALPAIASDESPGLRADIQASAPVAAVTDRVTFDQVGIKFEPSPSFGEFAVDSGLAVHYVLVSARYPLGDISNVSAGDAQTYEHAKPNAEPVNRGRLAELFALLLGGAVLLVVSRYARLGSKSPYWRPWGDYKSVCSTG